MGGKKKKRQETPSSSLPSSLSLRSSSNRQDSGSPATSTAHQSNHVNTANVGCMSGIFQLMSKYHTRRKFLTFGRKQERNAIVHAPTTRPPQEKISPPHELCTTVGILSHDQAPRSPAIPAEIRRSSADSSSSSPRVVARLMGLEEIPVTSPAPAVAVSPAVQKRRKLLGALEKCDEDLQALKKIIEAVRATQTPPRAVEMRRREEVVEEEESEVGSDEPSPMSVLDHHYMSSSGYYHQRTPNNGGKIMQQQQKTKQQQKQQMTRKKPGDHEDKALSFLNKPSFTPQPLQLPARTTHHQLLHAAATTAVTGTPWSKAMKESVIEVCRDVEWGQRQEVGKIGLILQDLILRELIDEIIKELGSFNHGCRTCSTTSSFNLLPFEACKRQLSF